MSHSTHHHATPLRRKTDVDKSAIEQTIDEIAMTLCPPEEWEAYEARRHQLARRSRKTHSAEVKVFPIWWKYRREASHIATLQKHVPMLRLLPLKVSSVIGEILFH